MRPRPRMQVGPSWTVTPSMVRLEMRLAGRIGLQVPEVAAVACLRPGPGVAVAGWVEVATRGSGVRGRAVSELVDVEAVIGTRCEALDIGHHLGLVTLLDERHDALGLVALGGAENRHGSCDRGVDGALGCSPCWARAGSARTSANAKPLWCYACCTSYSPSNPASARTVPGDGPATGHALLTPLQSESWIVTNWWPISTTFSTRTTSGTHHSTACRLPAGRRSGGLRPRSRRPRSSSCRRRPGAPMRCSCTTGCSGGTTSRRAWWAPSGSGCGGCSTTT